MFDSTKAVIEKYNSYSEAQRSHFWRTAPIEELEIIAEHNILNATPSDTSKSDNSENTTNSF